MQAMGEQISKVVNVTIHYPEGVPTFADFIAGKVKSVNVQVEVMPVSANLIGDYSNDLSLGFAFSRSLIPCGKPKMRKLRSLPTNNSRGIE